ncbi:MAG: quinone oxidoreductase family protein [Burkholderiaceae bacterium]
MSKAVQLTKTGAPSVMKLVDVTVKAPAAGEIQIEHKAIGLNYIDVYFRTGQYPQELPAGLGMEGAGLVTRVGRGVKDFKIGDRVAYAGGAPGAYSEVRNLPASMAVKVPKGVDLETAAAMMLQGMTVEYLFNRTYKLKKGDTILFHAAAGGVGLIAMQWAKALGVTVIGTVGSKEKGRLAKAHGCDHVIYYKTEDVAARVRRITKGKMVPVVYDAVGKDTFQGSLDSLQDFGLMVSFGNASGPVPPVPLTALRGSLFITRPSLMSHTRDRKTLDSMARNLFKMVKSGAVKIRIDQTYSLDDVVQAHTDLEARKTTGSTILTP